MSTSHFESPTGFDLDDIRSDQLQHVLTWFCGAEPRVFAADMDGPIETVEWATFPPRSACVTDLRKRRYHTQPGYTYKGVLNMNAKPALHGRVDRILCSQYMTKLSRAITLVGTIPLKKLRAEFAPGAKSSPVRPSDRFGLLADFATRSPKEHIARNVDQSKAPPCPSPPGRLPKQEEESTPPSKFCAEGVTSQNPRDALASLGVAVPTEKSVASTSGMFKIAFPTRSLCGNGPTVKTLTDAMRILRLPCSGGDSDLS